MFGYIKRPSNSSPANAKHRGWPLDMEVLELAKNEKLTLAQLLAGLACFGASGSGKTSTIAMMLAIAFLKSQFGGVICTTKPGEVEMWIELCRRFNRQDDLLIFGKDQPWKFNFLQYELDAGTGAGEVENVVQTLLTVLELSDGRGSSGGGGENGDFFDKAKKQLLRATVEVLIRATGHVSVSDMYRLIISAPTSPEQLDSDSWRNNSFCIWCFQEADKRAMSDEQRKDLALVTHYWLGEYVNMSSRTRASIVSTVTGTIDILQKSPLRELLCTETNFTPMDTANGKIILLNMNTKTFRDIGQVQQVVFKTSFQRAIERRDVRKNPRPVFLFMDEFQHFATRMDTDFAATCRSARVAMVLLTQNLPLVYASRGGNENAKMEVDGLLGNLGLKVLFANGDRTTNQWASESIGSVLKLNINANQTFNNNNPFGAVGNNALQCNAGVSESMLPEVDPGEFTRLRTGGIGQNKCLVDAILFASGHRFRSTGRPWRRVTFKQ